MAAKTIYFDVAGDAGWPPPFGRSRVKWYILAGLVLESDADMKASKEVRALLEEFAPGHKYDKHPQRHYEINYHDIIYGANAFSHLKDKRRKEMSDKIFDIITSSNPVIFATAINKIQMKKVYSDSIYGPRMFALRATIRRFSLYLERGKHVGSIVVDEEEHKKDREVRQLIHELRGRDVSADKNGLPPMVEGRLGRVLNAVHLSPSELSPGIQLVDVCSRSIWGHFEKQKSNRFKQLERFFDRDDGVVYEPAVIPSHNKWV